jgi:hypothetical protein
MPGLLDKLRTPTPDDDLGPEFSNGFPDEFDKDPVPGKPGRKPAMAAPAKAAGQSTRAPRKPAAASVRKQVADELHAYISLAAMTWSLRDPHCGGVLDDNARKMADALAELIARNPKLVEWIHTSGLVGDWMKLFMVFTPLVSAIRDHHITKTVGVNDADSPDLANFPAYRP